MGIDSILGQPLAQMLLVASHLTHADDARVLEAGTMKKDLLLINMIESP